MDVNEFVAFLDQASGRLDAREFREDLEKCVPVIEHGFTDNFARSATADGQSWPPRKSKRGKNPLLILTGALIRSVGGQAPGHVERVGDLSLELGTNLPYAGVHEFGYPGRNIPARPYLDVPEQDMSECHEILAEALARTVLGG